ncbi:unnamed protein product [Schistosoma haematobium]|nr:unnamed protein product [Schistosoma haematobium]
MQKKEADGFTVILYKRRWFSLLIFCLCSFGNAYQWIHLNIISDIVLFFWDASIPGSSVDTKTISVDWLSMIYMLTYIPLIFPSNWILNRWGLRVTLLVASALNAVGGCIKCIAGAVTYETTFGQSNKSIPFSNKLGFPILMAGQTICGIAQSGILGIPAHLAAVWFGVNEVSTATALGVFGNQLGVAFGFLVPPLILPSIPYSSNGTNQIDPTTDMNELFNKIKHYMMIMLYFSAALNILPFIFVLFGFRAKPKTEPSLAQYKRSGSSVIHKLHVNDQLSIDNKPSNGIHSIVNNNGLHEKKNNIDKEFYTKSLDADQQYPALSSNEHSISSTKQDNLNTNDSIMNNFIINIDDKNDISSIDNYSYQSLQNNPRNETISMALKRLFKNTPFILLFISYGILTGVYYAVGTLLNSILLGYFTNSNLSGWAGFTMIIAGIFGSVITGVILDKTKKFKLITCIIYILSLLFMGIFTGILYFRSMPIVFIIMFCLGFFMTGYLSIGFELAAELTYPESEGLSSGLLNTSAQIFGLILIHVATPLRTNYGVLPGNLFLTGLTLIGTIMTVLIKENLYRQQAHERVSFLSMELLIMICLFYQ